MTFAISAVVLSGLASIAPVLMRAIDRSVASVQNVDALSRTLGVMRRDISSLTRARWNGIEPQSFVFRGGPNSLFFVHREIDPAGRAELRVIALREIVTGNGPRWVRSDARLSPDAQSFDELNFGPQRVLDIGPARLRLWYRPMAEDGAPPSRARAWPAGRSLPQAVVIEAIDVASAKVIVTIEAPIRANADIGCILRRLQYQPTPPGVQTAAAPGSATSVNPAAWLAGASGSPLSASDPAAMRNQTDSTVPFCGRPDVGAAGSKAAPALSDKPL